jgi:ribokinase
LVEIAVLGAINWDINLFVKTFPKIGEEIPVKTFTEVPGGKAANIAVAASRILGPGSVSVIGCLGRDQIAETQINALREEGVVTSAIKLVKGDTSGRAYILIDETGHNMILTIFGANLKFSPEFLECPTIKTFLQSAKIITIIDSPIETIKKVTSMCCKEEKIVAWDAGVWSALGIKPLKKILQKIDYLIINEVEIKNLTGIENPLASWKILSKINNDIKLIAKLGSSGCVIIGSNKIMRINGINLRQLKLKVVNTAGCGDAFTGVFVASKVENFSDKEALKRANLAGALKATKWETRGSPVRSELEHFLNLLNKKKLVNCSN